MVTTDNWLEDVEEAMGQMTQKRFKYGKQAENSFLQRETAERKAEPGGG